MTSGFLVMISASRTKAISRRFWARKLIISFYISIGSLAQGGKAMAWLGLLVSGAPGHCTLLAAGELLAKAS